MGSEFIRIHGIYDRRKIFVDLFHNIVNFLYIHEYVTHELFHFERQLEELELVFEYLLDVIQDCKKQHHHPIEIIENLLDVVLRIDQYTIGAMVLYMIQV